MQDTKELIPGRDALEAEHGPILALRHPTDGSVFGFKLMGRAEFDLRASRLARTPPDLDASDKLMQERCVWPSRDAWNTYAAKPGFGPETYFSAYHAFHGGKDVTIGEGDGLVLTDGDVSFSFRIPARPEIKRFRAESIAKDPRALENLLRACALSQDFGAWLDAHLFGIATFGDALVAASGMGEANVVGK